MTIGIIGKMFFSVVAMFGAGKAIEVTVDWGLQKIKLKKKSQSSIEEEE